MGDPRRASQIGRLCTPGRPKAISTPSRSSASTTRAAPVSDNVELRSEQGGVEALDAERRDVHERLAPQHQVAHDLADGRALEEAVAGEAGRVQEARHLARLTDHRVVVGRHLVEAGPAAADAGT